MRQIAFSGMWCAPDNVIKEGDFKIRGTVSPSNMVNHPPVHRYESFASTLERDIRYTTLMRQLDDSFWV